jgi:hypothetical protein
MTTYFKVPKSQSSESAPYPPVEPGEYRVEVMRAVMHSPDKLVVQFKVLDEGKLQGAWVRENFLTSYPQSVTRLEEFAGSIGVPITEEGIDTEACVGKTLYVSVVRDGKWDNIASHRPDF